MRLTDIGIRALPIPPVGQKTYFDDALSGFGVRVSQGGTKSYVVLLGEKRQRKTIGRYPEKSLKDARNEARVALGAKTVTKAPQDAISDVTGHVAAFLIYCQQKNRPRTVKDYERHLRLHLPHPPTRAKLAERFMELSNRPGEYRHAFLVIRTFLNWCVSVGHLERSPLDGLRLTVTPQPRSRVLTAAEIKAVWAHEDRPFTDVVRLMILTGQRRSEITAIKPEWVADGFVHLPGTATKNRRPHSFPIGPQARDILTRAPFQYQGWSKGKARMDKATGVAGYTLHDLRRTFVSHHAAIGTPLHITEKMVNHISGSFGGIVSVYNQYQYLTEMSTACLQYEAYIGKLVDARA